MEYIKIRFGDDLDRLDSRFEKTIDEMFRAISPAFSLSERTWNPQMDIYETPEEIFIRAEVAGVEQGDLGVEINQKAVKIFGSRKSLPPMRNATYRLAEIQYGHFERILYLPSPIDPEVVSSAYTDGILQLRLAKIQTDRVHKIPISDE